jgi:hypothetical protein
MKSKPRKLELIDICDYQQKRCLKRSLCAMIWAAHRGDYE